MHQRLLPFPDNEFNLTLLGSAVLHLCREPMTIRQLERRMGELRMIFYQGEIEEIVWRMIQVRRLRAVSDGRTGVKYAWVPGVFSGRSLLPAGTWNHIREPFREYPGAP